MITNFAEKPLLRAVIVLAASVSFFFGVLASSPLKSGIRRVKNMSISNNTAQVLSECHISRITAIPAGATLIVGHAYGSHAGSSARKHDGIAPKVKELVADGKDSIHKIIFSGDVISKPSVAKWREFVDFFAGYFILIAPGNHDVAGGENIYDNAYRDIFYSSNGLHSNDYPILLVDGTTAYVIDDSTTKNSSERLLSFLKALAPLPDGVTNLIVVRHHVLSRHLLQFANGSSMSGYFSNSDLEEIGKLFDPMSVTFVYGDGGAFSNLPRLKCLAGPGGRHIVNGIGELDGDLALIVNKGQVYSYKF